MNPEKNILRIGAIAILLAVIFRLTANGILQPLSQASITPDVVSFLTYLETGRILPGETLPSREFESKNTSIIPTAETVCEESVPEKSRPVYTKEDLSLFEIRYDGEYRPDTEALITAPLNWNLRAEKPSVLIVHTHGCESYDDVSPEVWRNLDSDKNMIAIGDLMTEHLENAGISVIHDRSLHDYPSYNGSYMDARESTEEYLSRYPSIDLILDLHRDAADDGDGQLDTSVEIDGTESAQLMIVVGSDEGGLEHDNWEENLSFGLKLTGQLEKLAPGIIRYVSLRTERFNEDLSPHALLIEVGGAGNTIGEAKIAVSVLADAVIAMADGAN